MKKIVCLLSLMIAMFGLFGCTKWSISYAENNIEIYENQVYEIDKEKIETSGKNGEFIICSLDEKIAKIDGFNVIAVSSGNTKIRLQMKDKESVFFDINLTVKSGKIAKTCSVQNNKVYLDLLEDNFKVNKVLTNDDCNEIPTVTFDESVIDYDYQSGEILAKTVGETKVTIKYLFCETSFDVEVEQKIYVKSLSVISTKVYANSEGKLDFLLSPKNANTYSFYKSEQDKDREDFIINTDGSYKSFDATKITLTYLFYDEKNHKIEPVSFEIEVIDKVQSISCEIVDENGARASNIFVNQSYKLIVKLPEYIESSNIIVSSDFAQKSNVNYVKNSGYEMTFLFKNIGDKTLQISLSKTLGGVTNEIFRNINLKVKDEKSIEIGCKWSGTEISKTNGKFVIYLEGDGIKPDDLSIMLKVNGEFVNDLVYSVYLLVDNQRSLASSYFKPTSEGNYTFEVEFNGEIIGTINVLVK